MKYFFCKSNRIIVLPDMAFQRIDNFLHARLKGVPRSMIYRILRTGIVRINQKRTKPQYKLQNGDEIKLPYVEIRSQQHKIDIGKKTFCAKLEDLILYEDDYVIGINKPSGLAVHGGSGLRFGVIEALRALRPNTSFLELVHRLDRATSGVLLLAKKRSSLRMLHEQFREKTIKKEYLALVQGEWPTHITVIDAPLLKSININNSRIMRVHKEGKPSTTLFKIEEKYKKIATLVKVSLITGRMHQIRVHALHAGHPIALDDRYGSNEFHQTLRDIGLQRLFLHANTLSFIHPHNGKNIFIIAPLDQKLKKFLEKLRSLVKTTL
ncbi:23S rRNA pseudouridine(955/2504/2580) synthase RluC [Candidatus Erwinia haradaeae]|uniref:Pseudouridine synthase n=1 Tax=Candidatus Erwinia haradaeae TaxID=1922217 RepID=A0A451D1P8_9GAMM|nr:23S rRNA pseudouridine(955/2504/2580) synthase RluC [Candidatus Erwinia haradaeae]VFP79539.1 Ribosomal large subunit pseudouridine synthase C [Candidatus Erwinia haradaeae]